METQTRVIKDREFSCRVLPFGTATKVLTKFTQLVGPAMSAAAIQGSNESFIEALSSLLRTVDDSHLQYFANAFGTHSKCDGKNLNSLTSRDAVFTGRMSDFFLWLRFCFEVNFSDFFDEARNLMSDPGSDTENPQTQPVKQ